MCVTTASSTRRSTTVKQAHQRPAGAGDSREHCRSRRGARKCSRSPKLGDIAGSIVTEGYVKRVEPDRVLRDNVVIYEGELESLRRFKDDVNEVRSGTECGIGVKNYNDVKVGDQIECYETVVEVKPERWIRD